MADVKGKMPFFVSKTNPVTVTGLQASTSYNFQLVVYDKNENSTVWEEPITFKTLPATPILKNFQLQLIKPTSEFIKATFNVTTTDKITKAVINSDLNNKNFDFTLNEKIENMSYDHQTYPYYCLLYINDTNISDNQRYKLCISKNQLKFVQYQNQNLYNVKITYDDNEQFYIIESDTIDGLLTQSLTDSVSYLNVYENHTETYLLSNNQYKFDYLSSNYDTNFFSNSSNIATRTYYNYCSLDDNGDGVIYLYNLSPKTVYSLTLNVFDSYNQVATAGPSTIVTQDIPPVITNVIEQSIKQHEITIYVECETNVGIKTYTYNYSSNSVTTPQNPYTIANLDIFTDYTFTITVTDINGQTDTIIETIKTSGSGPRISDLSISEITTSTAKATVTATSQDQIDRYVWSCNNKVSQTEENTIEIENLSPYTNYNLNVRVYDINDNYDTRNVEFTTQSDGIDISTCTVNNINYTSFDITLTTEKDIPINNIEIELTNIDDESDVQTFSGFNDLNFTVNNIYPNKTYTLKIRITDIDNVTTVYNYPSNITMKSSNIIINDIIVSNVLNTSFSCKIDYNSDILVDNLNINVQTTDGQSVYNQTQPYTNNIFNITDLNPKTEYNIIGTIMFNNFSTLNQSKQTTITTLSNSVYIYFDVDGGTTIDTLQKYQNDIINLDDYVTTKIGYNFDGWYIGDTKYTGNYTIGETDVTFVAHWNIKTFNVTFQYYGEGATYDNKNTQSVIQQVNYGESAIAPTLPDTSLTYNFTSWNNDFSYIEQDMTVIAQYTGVEYYISFQSEFGTIDGLNEDGVMVYIYGEAITTLPTISGISQDFNGWSTEQGNPDNIITTSTIWTFTDVDILYAIFEMYKLTYNYGDGIGYNTISLLNANGFSYYNTTENSGTIEVIDNNTIVLNAVSGTKHTLRSIMQISSTNNGMIAYANVDNNADINIQIINNTDNPTYNLETLIPNEISQNIYIDLIVYVPSSPGTYNIRNIDIKGLYEQSPEYQYKTVGEQVGTLPITWSNNKGIIGKWYSDEQGTTEILSTTVFNKDTTIYAIYKPKELKSILLDGNSFNSIYRSTAPNASALYFTNTKIPNDKISNAKIVSISNSPCISYLYMDGNNAYVSPEEDNIPIYANENCSKMFYSSQNLYYINFENFNTSKVTDMNYMFNYTGSNATACNLENISNWDVSNVTNMKRMFASAGYSATTWNLDLSGWDTGKVTDMNYMFASAGYSATTWNLSGISNWDVSNVTNMSGMFNDAGYSTTTWNLDLSGWDTGKVTDMNSMFSRSGYKSTTWNLGNISNWGVENVTNMDSMFKQAGYSATTWNLDLSGWKTINVTNMRYMFDNSGHKSTTWNLDLSGWDTGKVTDMNSMFNSSGYFSSNWSIGDLSNWNVEKVTNMSYMFSSAGEKSDVWSLGDISNWKTYNVTNMQYMFDYAGYSATTWSVGDLNNWDTSNVTNMNSLFNSAGYSATTWSVGDLSSWDTSNVTNMNRMFYFCPQANTNITIRSTATTSYSSMFQGAASADDAQIIVKFVDDDTKALAEKMVATKSSNSNVYLYSQTTISFDSTGGNNISSTITATIGEPIQNLPTPVRGGYSFDGWKNPNDSSIITNGSIWKYGDSTITLQATWSVSTGYIVGNPSTTGASQNPISVGLNFDGMGYVKTDFPAIQNNNGVYTGTSISEEEGIILYEPALKFEGLAWNGITLRFYNSSTAPILVRMYYERTSPMGNVLTSYAITINPGQQEEIMSMMSAGGFNLYIVLQNTSGDNYELRDIAIEVI